MYRPDLIVVSLQRYWKLGHLCSVALIVAWTVLLFYGCATCSVMDVTFIILCDRRSSGLLQSTDW